MFQICELDYIKVGDLYLKQLNKSTKETNRDCIGLHRSNGAGRCEATGTI